MFKQLFFVFAILFTTQSSAALWGAEDYDECVIEAMKGVTSDVAARAIKSSCRAKFTPKIPETEDITKYVSKTTEAKGGFYTSSYNGELTFEVSLYNGNSDYIINNMIVRLSYKDKNSKSGSVVTRDYRASSLGVYPLSNGKMIGINVEANKPELISWDIVKYLGYKK